MEDHLEGLLHLAAFAFAMTLAYLGLDKIGAHGRANFDAQLDAKAREVGRFFGHDEFVDLDAEMNELHGIVGDRRTRKAICMLFALAGRGQHDLYRELWFGPCLRLWHNAELFFVFRCYQRQHDMKMMSYAALLTGLLFLGLTAGATFSDLKPWVHSHAVKAIFGIDSIVALLVIAAVSYAATSIPRLDGRYRRWQRIYGDWVQRLRARIVRGVEVAVERDIDPDAPQVVEILAEVEAEPNIFDVRATFDDGNTSTIRLNLADLSALRARLGLPPRA